MTQEVLKQWEELDITDDFMFGKVMRDVKICKRMIEVILGIEVDHIEYPEEQKVIDITADAKSVRMDVYVKDSKNSVYNIEMQPSKRGHLPKRSRYYQSMIDLDQIEKGHDYSELNRSFVIFICTYDLFGRNRCIYTFENRCIQDNELALNDGTVKIFLNSKGDTSKENEDLKAFLDYVEHKVDRSNAFVDTLEQAIQKVRENKEWRLEYMTLAMKFREMREDGRAQGFSEGKALGLSEGRTLGLTEGKALGLSEGEILKLISQIRKKYMKNVSAQETAEMLEESEAYVSLVMSLFENEPNANDEMIYEKLNVLNCEMNEN